MIIRRMCEADLDQVTALEQEIFSDPWTRGDFAAEISAQGHCYLVVEEEGEILGYCGYWGVAGEAQIFNVAVRPASRGRGSGRQMMEALMNQGKEDGLTEFTLEVRISNEPAIRLYHGLGFQDVGIRKRFYQKPVEDALLMTAWME